MEKRLISKKNGISVMICLLVVVSILVMGSTLTTNAKENNGSEQEKYYKSIVIEDGDSLWSIAEAYKPNENISTSKYIKDLKKINNMTGDTIHEGNYLTIYYYNEQ